MFFTLIQIHGWVWGTHKALLDAAHQSVKAERGQSQEHWQNAEILPLQLEKDGVEEVTCCLITGADSL
jgi:hypothetical protein